MAQYKLSNIHKVDYNRNAENSVNETAGIEQQYGASGIQRNTKLKPDSKLGLLRYKSAIVKREDAVNKTTESSSHASPVSPSKSQLGKKRIVGGTCQLASESTGGHLSNGNDIKQVSSCETGNIGNAKGVVNTKSRLVVHKSLSSKSFGRADQHVRRIGGALVGIKDTVAVDKTETSISDAGFNPCSPTKSRSLGSLVCDKSIKHGRNSLDKTSSILKSPLKTKPPNLKASMNAKQPSRKSRDGASSKSSLTESSVSESDLEKLELNSPGEEMGSGLQLGNKSRKQSSPAASRFKPSRKPEGFQMSSKLKVAACEDVNASLAMNKHVILLDVTPNGDFPTKLGCSSVDKYEKVRSKNFFGRGTNLSNGDDGICSRESMVSESSSEPVAMTVGNVVILDEIIYHQMLDDITSLKKSLTDLWDLLSIQQSTNMTSNDCDNCDQEKHENVNGSQKNIDLALQQENRVMQDTISRMSSALEEKEKTICTLQQQLFMLTHSTSDQFNNNDRNEQIPPFESSSHAHLKSRNSLGENVKSNSGMENFTQCVSPSSEAAASIHQALQNTVHEKKGRSCNGVDTGASVAHPVSIIRKDHRLKTGLHNAHAPSNGFSNGNISTDHDINTQESDLFGVSVEALEGGARKVNRDDHRCRIDPNRDDRSRISTRQHVIARAKDDENNMNLVYPGVEKPEIPPDSDSVKSDYIHLSLPPNNDVPKTRMHDSVVSRRGIQAPKSFGYSRVHNDNHNINQNLECANPEMHHISSDSKPNDINHMPTMPHSTNPAADLPPKPSLLSKLPSLSRYGSNSGSSSKLSNPGSVIPIGRSPIKKH